MLRREYSRWAVNLLVALAISLVVNFSYLLLLLVDDRSADVPQRENRMRSRRCNAEAEGVLRIHPDGYGYLVALNGAGVVGRDGADGADVVGRVGGAGGADRIGRADSAYVAPNRIRRYALEQGDTLSAIVQIGRSGANPAVKVVRRINGEAVDPARLYRHPSRVADFTVQMLYYLILSFVVVSLLTSGAGRRNYDRSFYLRRMGICLIVVVPLYVVAPVVNWPSGRIMLNFMSGHLFDYMVVLRHTFAVTISLLYGYLFGLLRKSQQMTIENERLQNENLTSRYNMLVSQINPHFFFNSLNSLAMLVRESHRQGALDYIDRLSYVFRYILQSGQSMLVTLDEELRFAEAYSYLFKTRYADKLFFDFSVDDEHRHWLLPSLTLQPLMENAVKHNSITRTRPFHVLIGIEGDSLVVRNPRIQKMDPEPGTGIGLENLKNRWELLTGEKIEVRSNDDSFEVRMPLQKPIKK